MCLDSYGQRERKATPSRSKVVYVYCHRRPSRRIDAIPLTSPQVLNVGKTLAYTETRILHPETGKLLATGLHTKFVGKSHGHKRNVVFDETGDNIVEGQIEE